jgi:hypothetical protein
MSQSLYDLDFIEWTRRQAEALRARGRGSNAVDWERVAEEIEDMGVSERRACESFIEQILIHFLKIAYVGPVEAVEHWRAEIVGFRVGLERRLTPSLRAQLPAELPGAYADALRILSARLKADGLVIDLPRTCPYSWDDILGRESDWVPETATQS